MPLKTPCRAQQQVQAAACAMLSRRCANTFCCCKQGMAATPLSALSAWNSLWCRQLLYLFLSCLNIKTCHRRWGTAAIPSPMPSAWRRFMLSGSSDASNATLALQQRSQAPAAAMVALARSQQAQHSYPCLEAQPAQGQAPSALPSRRVELHCLGSLVRGPVPLARRRAAACLAAAPLGQHPHL